MLHVSNFVICEEAKVADFCARNWDWEGLGSVNIKCTKVKCMNPLNIVPVYH